MNKYFLRLILVIILWFSLLLTSVMAQADSKQVIKLDGRELFEVANLDSFPGKFRADWINSQLNEVVESEEKPEIKIETQNESPIISLNNRYLLTVTEKDTLPDISPEDQASIWAKQITQAVERAQEERTKSYLILRILGVTGLLIVFGIINWFLGVIWQKLYSFWSKNLNLEPGNPQSKENKILTRILDSSLLLVRIFLWLFVSLYISNLFPVTRSWSYQIRNGLLNSFTLPFISVGKNSYSILDFLFLGIFLIVLFIVANSLSNLLRTRILVHTRITRGIQEAITIVAKYTFISIGTLVILQLWGFDLSSLTILASAIGVAIGFGFQDIAKNFGSGLVLLFERPIQVGDFVQVSHYMGIVEYIGARSTLIRTLDQISIIVPNSRFLENEVINWSHQNPLSRLHIPVGVSYNSDVQLVKTALLEASQKCSDVLNYPSPQALFLGFGDSAINFELLVWIQQPQKQMIIKSDLYFAIEASFKAYNIEIPYSQQDLHLRSGKLPVELLITKQKFNDQQTN